MAAAYQLRNLKDAYRKMRSVGRTTCLVIDDSDIGPSRSQPEHCLDEVVAIGTNNPRRAQNNVFLAGCRHALFALQLSSTVDAKWGNRIILTIWCEFCSVEYVIRGYMYKWSANTGTGLSDKPCTLRVNGLSNLRLLLRLINGCVGRSVDDKVGFITLKGWRYRFRFGKVNFRSTNGKNLKTIRLHRRCKRSGKLPLLS